MGDDRAPGAVVVGGVVVAGGVVVTGGTVVGGAVVVTGGAVTGVVVGTGVGTSVKITPELGAVVAGAGVWDVAGGVDERTGGAEGTVVVLTVLVVVEGEGSTAANRLPSKVVEVVVTAAARVTPGLF